MKGVARAVLITLSVFLTHQKCNGSGHGSSSSSSFRGFSCTGPEDILHPDERIVRGNSTLDDIFHNAINCDNKAEIKKYREAITRKLKDAKVIFSHHKKDFTHDSGSNTYYIGTWPAIRELCGPKILDVKVENFEVDWKSVSDIAETKRFLQSFTENIKINNIDGAAIELTKRAAKERKDREKQLRSSSSRKM